MNVFKADLHIHTILSPCASIEMSPVNIVSKALEQHLDIIGVTDHNSTLQCEIVIREASKVGLMVYPGVEVTTKEEIHCLAFFSSLNELSQFQAHIDQYLPAIKNDTSLFGYQVVVDENENIVYEEERLLISALQIGIDKVEQIVHHLNGIFIPAHVNKSKNSLISQLGFVPPSLKADAFELSRHMETATFISQNRLKSDTVIIRNSDAHMQEQIGEQFTQLYMESPEFNEFILALNGLSGRKVISQ